MRLSAAKLQQVMMAQRLNNEELAAMLSEKGYSVNPNIVKKWRKALQPDMNRIRIIEEVLGCSVTEEPKARRSRVQSAAA